MKIFTLCCLFSVWALTAVSQNGTVLRPDGKQISKKQIDRIIQVLMDSGEVTGLCLGIINDNKPVYIKAYGWKNLAKKEVNDTATVFYAASYSKSVFAYFVMQLVDEGKIDLDKPLYQYLPKPLPEYSDYKDLAGDERWKLITARHCLSHSTGFPNWRWLNPRGNEKLEIFFTPGERYAYSGEGLQLLQLAVETIMKRDLESMMRERVFRPFGMRRSSYVWQLAFENNYSLPYDENGNVLLKAKNTEIFAAGSLETTIADYTRFIAAVMQGKGISERSKKAMLSPQVAIYTRRQFPSLNTDTTTGNQSIRLSYGLGWGMFYGKNGLSFFKEGHGDGWENYNINFPDKKISLILMTNSSNGESIFKKAVDSIMGEASIPWEWEGYAPFQPFIHLPKNILNEYTGVYERDGVEAIISLEDDILKVECKEKGLKKTTLYAGNDSSFFIKQFVLEIEFIRDGDGNVVRIMVNDEGQRYDMRKKTR